MNIPALAHNKNFIAVLNFHKANIAISTFTHKHLEQSEGQLN